MEFFSNWPILAELALIILAIFWVVRRNKSKKWARFFLILSILLIIITVTSVFFNLKLIPWFVMAVTFFLTMAMIVVFQPELRRILAQLGSRVFPLSRKEKIKNLLINLVMQLDNSAQKDTEVSSPLREKLNLNLTLKLEYK